MFVSSPITILFSLQVWWKMRPPCLSFIFIPKLHRLCKTIYFMRSRCFPSIGHIHFCLSDYFANFRRVYPRMTEKDVLICSRACYALTPVTLFHSWSALLSNPIMTILFFKFSTFGLILVHSACACVLCKNNDSSWSSPTFFKEERLAARRRLLMLEYLLGITPLGIPWTVFFAVITKRFEMTALLALRHRCYQWHYEYCLANRPLSVFVAEAK